VKVSAIVPMTGSYDYREVARSVLIAIAASYAALDLTGRVSAARGRVHLAWLGGGAVAMGIGIWGMHLKGMLAFRLPVSVEYHWPTILAALLVAIFASAVAMHVASREKMGWREALDGSVIMGAGIAGLHYIAMAAMRLPAITGYSLLLVTASLLLAVLFSLLALLMAFDLREETRWTVPRRLGSAIVMGLAISAMHYTGMAAASFIPASPPDLSHTVSISAVGNNAIAIVTLIVLMAATVTSSVDRRTSGEIQRLNLDLERRVAERTGELTTTNAALADSEQRFRRLVEALSDALFVISQERIVFGNPSGARLLGAERPEQIVGKELSEIVHPCSLASIRRRIQDSYQTGVAAPATEHVLLALDGSPVEIESASIPILWKGSPATEVIVRDIRESKQAEARLREYEKAVEGLEEMIVVVDRNYRYVLANHAYLRYRRLEREQLVGKLLSEILNKGVFETMVKPKLDEGFQGKVVKYEMRDRHAHLGERDLLVSYSPVEGQTGIDGLACVLQDITERKQAEEALRTSEREQHKIAEQLEIERARLIEAQAVAKVGSWETELPSLDVTWSEQTHRIFETDPSYFHPSRPGFVELVHPDDRSKVDAAFEASLEKGAPSTVEYRIVMTDGRVKVLEEHWKVFHDGQGRPARLIGTCQDTTERKRSEESLRLFRMLLDQSNDAIEVVDPETLRFIDVNGRACTDLGYSREELLSMKVYDISSNAESLNVSITEELRNSGSAVFESLHRRKDGSTFPVEVSIKQVHIDRTYRVSVVRDITERKHTEEALQEAQDKLALITRAQAMGELAATIAHEVNQPLTAIVTNANFSLRQLKGSNPNLEELRMAISEIANDSTRASAVISRIRGLLVKGTPRRLELDINEIVQEVITLLRHELVRNRIYLRTELAANLPRVQGDAVQLQQVLINLVMNAIEAMRLSTDRPRKLLIRSAKNAGIVLVQVQDSGPGIESGLADRIFEPFFTTKAEGIGMGLSIGHSIIESHGGQFSLVTSSQGALFEFTLPVTMNE
jgi:PAS domain S-box-containing protein